jgi:Ni/Co efflux regulator RcnB
MNLKTRLVVSMFLGGMIAAGPALADKPSWAGKGGKGKGHEEQGERHEKGKGRGHFEERHREIAREYYTQTYRTHCPPGLAKKNNGCMPPGQAKKWRVGRPLPRDVVYYEVPQPLVRQIGPPPPGHRYVRVAGDILMLAIGSGMVVDAIQNLTR